MNYNVVFHVDLADAGRLAFAFKNVKNYLKFLHTLPDMGNAKLVVVGNGPVVRFFVASEENAALAEAGAQVMAEGVSIRLCVNALNDFGIRPEDLWPGVGVAADGGITELARLQQEGYGYVKP